MVNTSTGGITGAPSGPSIRTSSTPSMYGPIMIIISFAAASLASLRVFFRANTESPPRVTRTTWLEPTVLCSSFLTASCLRKLTMSWM